MILWLNSKCIRQVYNPSCPLDYATVHMCFCVTAFAHSTWPKSYKASIERPHSGATIAKARAKRRERTSRLCEKSIFYFRFYVFCDRRWGSGSPVVWDGVQAAVGGRCETPSQRHNLSHIPCILTLLLAMKYICNVLFSFLYLAEVG